MEKRLTRENILTIPNGLSLIRLLLIPLIYILPRAFPADRTMAVYAAEPVADALAVVFTCILFAVHFKRAMRRIEAGAAEPAAR